MAITLDDKEYIEELRKEHRAGYREGYADAWKEIERAVKNKAYEAGIIMNADLKRDYKIERK